MNNVRAQVDVAFDNDDQLNSLITSTVDYDVRVTVINPHGPAGGWPVIALEGQPHRVDQVLRSIGYDDGLDDDGVAYADVDPDGQLIT